MAGTPFFWLAAMHAVSTKFLALLAHFLCVCQIFNRAMPEYVIRKGAVELVFCVWASLIASGTLGHLDDFFELIYRRPNPLLPASVFCKHPHPQPFSRLREKGVLHAIFV
jgi:hypothetical protein